MSVTNGKFTPTQQRILAVLADGQAHPPEELMGCLWDELSNITAVKMQIYLIRKKLRPAGQDILAEYVRRDCHYRHVRLINRSE